MTFENDPFPYLTQSYLTLSAYQSLRADDRCHPLAAIFHGTEDLPDRPWPQMVSHLRPLDREICVEVFFSELPVIYRRTGALQIAFSREVMFCGTALGRDAATPLTDASKDLYRRLLHEIKGGQFPHLLRVWNVLADINDEGNDLENYKQFCLGRHEAFRLIAPDLTDNYPSASAVGSHNGGLTVYCLAARNAGNTVENPNQISAYRYPPKYGPKSPSFSRALVKHWDCGSALFISGTASITGHETRHRDNCTAQVNMAIDNMETLVRAANEGSPTTFPLDLQQSILKVFIRNKADFPAIQKTISERLGNNLNALYLEADLCRRDLLFELEGALAIRSEGQIQRSTG